MIQARRSLVGKLRKKGILNKRVLEVIGRVPREIFIPESLKSESYQDTALPIGLNQTISQPYVVAKMTELLITNLADYHLTTVLEIGTGSGYQTAILSQLVAKIYSCERIKLLHQTAKTNLNKLHIDNVELLHQDGSHLPDEQRFDGMIITAGLEQIPLHLINSLKPGAVVIAPKGDREKQYLVVGKKQKNTIIESQHDAVLFVPYLKGTS